MGHGLWLVVSVSFCLLFLALSYFSPVLQCESARSTLVPLPLGSGILRFALNEKKCAVSREPAAAFSLYVLAIWQNVLEWIT